MNKKSKEKPRHLGRGLQSLLSPIISDKTEKEQKIPISSIEPKFPSDNELRESLRHISIDSISPNPYQPRMVWDEQEMSYLADSIKTNGLVQPIIVRPIGRRFQLIAGERRYRAAQMLSLKSIPALVRQASDEQLLELALVENIHRTNLNPIERAKAYQNYLNTFSLTQGEAAERLGEDRSVIANYIRLLDLPDEIKQMLIDGQLSMGHARAILAVPTDEIRRKLANRAMAGRLSVREVEKLVRRYLEGERKDKLTTTGKDSKPAHIMDLETRLSNQLKTKVNIETRKNGQRGKIVIEFYSLDEFDRIAEKIGLACMEET